MCSLAFSGNGQEPGERVGEAVSGSSSRAGVVALRSRLCGSRMSEGQHQNSLSLYQKVPLTDKEDSYNAQLHLLITREYFCSLSHEPPDTLWGVGDLHHHTHLAGESANSGPTRGNKYQSENSDSCMQSLIQGYFSFVTHTTDMPVCMRVHTHTHGRCTGEPIQVHAHRSAHRWLDLRTGSVTHFSLWIFA